MAEDNQPVFMKKTSTTNSLKPSLSMRRLNKKNLIYIGILIVTLVVAVGLLHVLNNNKSPVKTVNYSFDKSSANYRFMASHILGGEAKKTGFAFNIPWSQFVYSDAPISISDPRTKNKPYNQLFKDTGNHLEFGQRLIGPDRTVYMQSIIAAKIVPRSDVIGFNQFAYFSKTLAKYSFPELKETQVRLEPGDKVSAFTNASIKRAATIVDISVSPSVDQKTAIKHLKGQLITIQGKNGNYYMLIAAIDKVWDSGPKTWQATKDSLKIDQ